MDVGELHALFGVRANAIEALPFGEEGESYRVRTRDGRDFHLKSVPAIQATPRIRCGGGSTWS